MVTKPSHARIWRRCRMLSASVCFGVCVNLAKDRCRSGNP
ncbi:MAG: DUF4033 domain-containing protein [Euryarchaeota archaeon]|nr:DUF4033 domain-containing protein [Euryarchaeota archaeon]